MQISILLLTVVLLAILGLSGWIKQRKQYSSMGVLPPYRVRKSFMNTQEFAYYNALKQALGDEFTVYPKVRLPQVLSHPGHDPQFRVHWTRVQRRFVDFLVCDASLKPALAVKFDPAANRRHKNTKKEDVLEDALGAAELPLLRVVPATNYDLDEITYKIKFAMARHEPQTTAITERSNTLNDDFVDSENNDTDSRFIKLRRWTSDLWMSARRSN